MSVAGQSDDRCVEIKSFNESVPELADLLELSEAEAEQVTGGWCAVFSVYDYEKNTEAS